MTAVAAVRGSTLWTDEQLVAIERRDGDLLLDAGAGSGKTSVLVERFVRMVLEDGVDVSAILTITFTDKAAAELRHRIRRRLGELGAGEAARATESAFISTIHGFCARVLRVHALAAGLDPRFTVLAAPEAERVADAAFDSALEDASAEEGAGLVTLLASYSAFALRGAIQALYGELRSRGMTAPALAPLPPGPDLDAARSELRAAAQRLVDELQAIGEPGAKVGQALDRLRRCGELLAAVPELGELDGICLPGGNGAALSTPACERYAQALVRFRRACEHEQAAAIHPLLDRLLRRYGERYRQRKRDLSAVDFEDLELMARDLLLEREDLRNGYRARFAHVMVDELQDTNAVQLELIEQVCAGNLFAVGDAQQSIYAFRHADVELFERLGERMERSGARARLQTNFRSRPEILEAINRAFATIFSREFAPLRPGRREPPAGDPRVELLVVDKAADWSSDGLAAPWRIAEARALAARIAELLGEGASAREVVVLTRATTDLRAYERALEERGVPTYVIGGRGYWSHPQVVDLVAYLRALANPRDEEALYTVLASPLVGVSYDAFVLIGAAARASGSDPWSAVRAGLGQIDGIAPAERERLAVFVAWFSRERLLAGRSPVQTLIERALQRTGYDLAMLAMPGGRRRLANVRKLMRLAAEHEAAAGRDLRGFLDVARGRQAGSAGFGDERESEAPVEGEALDAVRLMTIHRAKGLEFPVVCVADLGRMPRRPVDLIRVGRDGRFGLRLSSPGTGKAQPALDYAALGEERLAAEAEEEHRLFYVALTRARERLIVSGAAKLEAWPAGSTPIAWLGPALVADIGARSESAVTEEGIRLTLVREPSAAGRAAAPPDALPPPATVPSPVSSAPVAAATVSAAPVSAAPGAPVSRLSYSSLAEYERCGYRFYVERVLGIPAVGEAGEGERGGGRRLAAAQRGLAVHALLERLDPRRPAVPDAAAVIAAAGEMPTTGEIEEITALIERFTRSEVCARLSRAAALRREERFSFALGEVVISGTFDVLALERGDRMLVVDYKTDRLEGLDPQALMESHYETQRLIYALAALRAGATEVEVVHVFLEAPEQPVSASYARGDGAALEAGLRRRADGVLRREFEVTAEPERSVCRGCPAEGGMCSWPPAMTRREAADRLF